MFQNTGPHCRTSGAACRAAPGQSAACPVHPPAPSAATPATCQGPHLPWSFKSLLGLPRRPKQLRSSSQQAAGRARPGRGLRVPRKPQAAQVEPGRRHRKSRVSSLPFLRGDPVTRKREVLRSGGSQRGSRPSRHAAPQALRFEARPARSCRRRRGEAASIASRAGAGEGSTGCRAGRLAEAAPAEAERTPPGRPARGHLGRCGGRAGRPAGRSGATRGTPGSLGRSATALRRPPGAGLAALSIRARRRRQLLRARSARLARRGPLRRLPCWPSSHPSPRPPEAKRPAVHQDASRRARGASSALSPRCRWDACLLAAPLGVPRSSSPEGFQLFFFFPLQFAVTSASIVFFSPSNFLFHRHLKN